MKHKSSLHKSSSLSKIPKYPKNKADKNQKAAKPIKHINPTIRHSEAYSSVSNAVCDLTLTVQGLKTLELKSPKRNTPQKENGIDNERMKIMKFRIMKLLVAKFL